MKQLFFILSFFVAAGAKAQLTQSIAAPNTTLEVRGPLKLNKVLDNGSPSLVPMLIDPITGNVSRRPLGIFFSNKFKVRPGGNVAYAFDSVDFADDVWALINNVTTPGNFVPSPDFFDSLAAIRRDLLSGGSAGDTYNTNDTLTENRSVYLNNQSVTFMNDPNELGLYSNATEIAHNRLKAAYKDEPGGTEAYGVIDNHRVELFSSSQNTDKYAQIHMEGADLTLEATDQTTGVHNGFYMGGDGTTILDNAAGNYYFTHLAPSGVGYNKVLIAKDTTVNGADAVKMAWKEVTELGADGNNYLTSGSLSGGTLTLNRNGLPDITVSGFNAGGLSATDTASMLNAYRLKNIAQDASIATNTTAIAGKQATLVSGTNIKTVNGNSLLGSGDITVSSYTPTVAVSALTTLTLSTADYNEFTGTSNGTWTLPALSSNTVQVYHVKNMSAVNLTVQRSGSDNLFLTGTTTTITLFPGDAYDFVDAGTAWSIH